MNAQYFIRRIVALAAASLWPAVMTNAQNRSVTELVPIPAGAFMMGSDTGPADERPAHRVEVAAFSIDRTPVTNAQAAEFLNAKGAQRAERRRMVPGRRQRRARSQEGRSLGRRRGSGKSSGARVLVVRRARVLRVGRQASPHRGGMGKGGARDRRPQVPVGKCPAGSDPGAVQRGMEWNGAGRKTSCGRQPVWRPGSLGERVGVGQQPVPAVSVQPARRPGRSCLNRRTGHARRRPGFGCEPFDDDVPRTRIVARPRGGHHNIGFRCAR